MQDSRPWSPEAQQRRFRDLAAFIRRQFRPLLSDDAEAPRLLWWDQPRVHLWSTQAFLAGDDKDAAFANTIIRHVRDILKPDTNGPMPFEASASASILAAYDDKLNEDTRDYLRNLLLNVAPHGTTRDFQFHGYNDNMPVMWSWALLFAGERYDRPELLDVARANLLQLKDMLRRRGILSEYGMGYANHRLTGIAHIAHHSRDAELRQLALDLEARLWAELAGHWNPALGMVCGASMRGGHPVNPEQHALFINVFGKGIERPWMPQENHFDTREVVRELGHDPAQYTFAYPFAYAAEFAGAVYHVPDQVAPLFYGKETPFTFTCTAECGYVHEGIFRKMEKVLGQGGIVITNRFTDQIIEIEDYPQHGAQPHRLVTHHGRNFSLGSASTNLFTTSHALRCTYRRTEDAAKWADIGELAIRYNINGKVPGGRTVNTYAKSPEYIEQADNYCQLYRDMGRHACMQHGPTVLCLSTPEFREHWDVTELRLDLCLLQQHGKVKHWELAADGSSIDLNEGAVYLRIRPLIGRHLERNVPIRVREIKEWLVVSLYNYEGPSRAFGKREIAKLGNGFVLEVRDAADFPSFQAFQDRMNAARALDQLYGGRRRVHYATPDLRLSTHYCPYAHTTMHASVNGLEMDWPQLAFSNGLERELPFTNGKEAPGFEDWEWIRTQIERQGESYNPQD